jgi:hypothetical protein
LARRRRHQADEDDHRKAQRHAEHAGRDRLDAPPQLGTGDVTPKTPRSQGWVVTM